MRKEKNTIKTKNLRKRKKKRNEKNNIYNIDHVNLVDTQEDISLSARVKSANKLAKDSNKQCIYVSIHANGFGEESANGWSVYTSPGKTKSDGIATTLFNKSAAEFPGEYMRRDTSDGDPDKESNFYVLVNTSMPAILSENFFMTNYNNCHDYLLPEEGRDRIAKIHFQMRPSIIIPNTDNMIIFYSFIICKRYCRFKISKTGN